MVSAFHSQNTWLEISCLFVLLTWWRAHYCGIMHQNIKPRLFLQESLDTWPDSLQVRKIKDHSTQSANSITIPVRTSHLREQLLNSAITSSLRSSRDVYSCSFTWSIFVSWYPIPDAAPVTIYTFPARDGRFLSVNFGGQGRINWERVEIGGLVAGEGMIRDVQLRKVIYKWVFCKRKKKGQQLERQLYIFGEWV